MFDFGQKLSKVFRLEAGKFLGNDFAQHHVVPFPGAVSDIEVVHEPLGANHAYAHAGLRDIFAAKDVIQVGDALAFVLDGNDKYFSGVSSMRNSTRPLPAYWKTLRTISETAVAMRVWS